MSTGNPYLVQLLEKYSSGQANAAETEELLELLKEEANGEELVSFMTAKLETFVPDNEEDLEFWKNKLKGGAERITGNIRPVHHVHFLRKWGWAAASVVLALGIGIYFYSNRSATGNKPAVAGTETIHPGKEGAVLTLADGTQVVLDSLGNGLVADQNGTQVILKEGGLAYDPAGNADGRTGFNTMSTPKGRQFQVTLPDGTRVWLNAASSLRYPTIFTGAERKVTLTGEAYFEVAKNSKMPFRVNVNDKSEVEVLGTQFNVNAYANESEIRTTLVAGSVLVKQDAAILKLKPGQQAGIRPQQPIKLSTDVDLGKVLAWKNGLFNFEGASLGEVMRQIERWYDIEVVYEKGIPDIGFEGKMTRDVPLNDLLTMLERSGIHCRIENRKLIVLP